MKTPRQKDAGSEASSSKEDTKKSFFHGTINDGVKNKTLRLQHANTPNITRISNQFVSPTLKLEMVTVSK